MVLDQRVQLSRNFALTMPEMVQIYWMDSVGRESQLAGFASFTAVAVVLLLRWHGSGLDWGGGCGQT
jgi:hypothetical protein